MKVHTYTDGFNTGLVDIEIGARVTICRTGGFAHKMFGEYATLSRVTSQHLVFVTDRGSEVKTSNWNLFDVRGKAAKAGYTVRLGEHEIDFVERVSFWNHKKGCFEYK